MNTIQTLHEEAMDLAELADVAKLRGELDCHHTLLGQALEKSVAAADALRSKLDAEPTRALVHRSAASLAVELGQFEIAERLLAIALAGNPPPEIAEELKDLFVQINLKSYFARRGLRLDTDRWELLKAG
ncbi:MAG: hypothetical protein HC771_20775 [Synechococcales cyanobacterium CRU_2_2]|nr:hypothetical protein [Synechococcales cyanobacterium CRU_2_2]